MKRWMAVGMAGAMALAAGCGTVSGPGGNGAGDAVVEVAAPAVAPVPAKPETRYVRRPHLQFRNEREMADYIALAARRERALENFRVLTRMLQEKAVEVKALNEQLEKDFKYVAGDRYDYNQQERVLYAVKEGGKGGQEKAEVMRLTPEQESSFIALLEARKRQLNEAGTLHASGSRAQNALIELQNRLILDYACARDREYELDEKTRTLIEKVPVPEKFELKGE